MKSYPRSYWFMCLNVLTFFISFNMLLPEMNAYITTLGGADQKWMILGLWTLMALIVRPLSGKIADNLGRKRVMYIGIGISVCISFLYPLFHFLSGFLILRFMHGASTGFHPTGATALLADFIPEGKRGQAMGIYSALIAIGFSSGQGLGSPVKNAFGINGLFIICGLLGLLSLVFLLFVKEDKTTLNKVEGKFWKNIIPTSTEIISPYVMKPAVLMFFSASIAGIYVFIVPEFSTFLKMENKGLFYVVNLVFVVATRLLAGKLCDKYGPVKNILVGFSLFMLAAYITGTSTTVTQFLLSSIIYGVAAGVISPALFSWTADLSDPKFKGRGMATLFLALEAGFFAGAFLTQKIYDNKPENFFPLFITVMGLSFIGLVYLLLAERIKPSK